MFIHAPVVTIHAILGNSLVSPTMGNKNMHNISVVIPTYNNKHLLYAHLDKYKNQSCAKFEVVVVNDGGEHIEYDSDLVRVINLEKNNGPAVARNIGARESKYNRVLFVGDDCLPSRDLVLHHAVFDLDNPHVALQGFTPFHPDVMDTRFMHWLDAAGMQAAWQNLREGEGWKRDITGFLLTTNFSMNKDDFFNLGGFPETFPTAAWEDICFGHTLNKAGYKTKFEPNAVNLHYHKHTIDSFMQRQVKEGRSRPILARIYPEFANSLINPNDLRGSKSIVIEELAAIMRKLQYIEQADIHEQMMKLMLSCSYRGVRETIDESRILQTLYYVSDGEYPAYVVTALRGLEEKNFGYVEHCIEWALQREPSNWATHAFVGECYIGIGKKAEALFSFKQAVEMNPESEWTNSRYNELLEAND